MDHSFKISRFLLNSITSYFNCFDHEQGGALLLSNNKIVRFIPLKNLSKSYSSFQFSFDELNEKINKDDEYNGIGIIHSHALSENLTSLDRPSKEDILFYKAFIMSNPGFDSFIFPIVIQKELNQALVKWYNLLDDQVVEVKLKVTD